MWDGKGVQARGSLHRPSFHVALSGLAAGGAPWRYLRLWRPTQLTLKGSHSCLPGLWSFLRLWRGINSGGECRQAGGGHRSGLRLDLEQPQGDPDRDLEFLHNSAAGLERTANPRVLG